MEPHHEMRLDSSLFHAIPIITTNDYVRVRGMDGKISEIVTSGDLSSEFRKLTEPFLLVSEIENWVRNMIQGRFTVADLASVCNPSREIDGVGDLVFGEYIRLLQDPNRWMQLGVHIDRAMFCEQLDLIREIRNDVMHFKLDIKSEDLESLHKFAGFLKTLGQIFRSK